MRWRFLTIGLVAVASAVVLATRGIKLGLDLKGGSYFVFRVQKEKAVENFVSGVASEFMNFAKQKYQNTEQEYQESITPVLFEGERIYVLPELVPDFEEKYKSFERVGEQFLYGTTYVVFALREDDKKEIEEFAVLQALETIRGRVDEFGVAEPQIFRQGKDRIVVQLPGVTDPERAKKIIGKTAVLEFRLLDDEQDIFSRYARRLPKGIYLSTEVGTGGKRVSYLWSEDYNKLYEFVKKITPPLGRVIFIGKAERGNFWRTYLLHAEVPLTGRYLTDARVRMDAVTNQPFVLLRFNSEGADIFEELTAQNVGKRLAIILDEKVYSAPVIRERITGGTAVIEGQFTIEEARDLATVLRAGALPAPLVIEEERTIGPTLGKDSIRKGALASFAGAGAVLLFMSGYYRFFGFVSIFGLGMTVLVILAVLSLFGATLTLPGIAGVALTIGMAVDNTIIMFERIREEILKGGTGVTAVERGIKNALRAILDANITTLIAALFIFQFGTGPVRGFALTLSIGIFGALFGTVFCTRTFITYLARRGVLSI